MEIPDSMDGEIVIYNLENQQHDDMLPAGTYLHVNDGVEDFKIQQANPTGKEISIIVSCQSTCNQTH